MTSDQSSRRLSLLETWPTEFALLNAMLASGVTAVLIGIISIELGATAPVTAVAYVTTLMGVLAGLVWYMGDPA